MKPTFTESQVKALLVAAVGDDPQPVRPYNDLLEQALETGTSIDALRRIKDQAKEFLKTADDARHRDGAQLLYHVAVASAFVNHAAEISGRPMQKQRDVYERFAERWIGQPLGELFREVIRRIDGQSTRE
jgi:hypothetical protein